MGFDPTEPKQRRQLRAELQAVDITVGKLWLNYFSIGGAVGEYEVEAYLQGLLSLPRMQRDLLAMAANELIDSVPRLRAPYADDLTESPDARHYEEKQDTSDPRPAEGVDDHRPGEQEPG
ncbi:hypothetical protein [Arthrobacter oryzae]|uniref:hypothetical protein n=1 Tax=Arthrobacter oryzae TaxID=409290 RepID=UPI002860FF46|nr:hypothetical protein [Arthrobacter oryzae]MDR6508405.1 hypothetical protein [Arthrobacter oryzae]